MHVEGQFGLDIGQEGEVTVVTVAGDLDVATAPQLTAALDTTPVATGTVVFDFSPLRFIDSSGLAVLAALLRREPPPRVVVKGASTVVRRVLDISQLSAMITVED